ncbi:MAG: glycine cleavage system protein H [Thermoplasmata archaeon]
MGDEEGGIYVVGEGPKKREGPRRSVPMGLRARREGRGNKEQRVAPARGRRGVLKVGGLHFPLDRFYYARRGAHVWLKPERGGVVRIGLDSFLARTAGHMNYIALGPGETARQGRSLGSFESAKFVSRLISPLSGRVVEVNQKVMRDPRLINKSPYDAWILAIRPERLERELLSPDILSEPEALKSWILEEMRKAEG